LSERLAFARPYGKEIFDGHDRKNSAVRPSAS
jgi:hypothetical protein